jgi:hypothetical protein
VEDALDVEGKDALPGRLVKVFDRGTPGRPCVVDQDVETVLASCELGRKALALCLG